MTKTFKKSLYLQLVEQSNPEGKEESKTVNFMQARDLTDEEWLALPKEEILQLYKNCYKMLMDYVHPSSETSKADHIADNGKMVEPSEQRTAEEILKKVCNYDDNDPLLLGDEILVEEALEAMQEYKAQGSVTDEEIEDIAKGRKPYKKYVDEDGFDCEHKFWFTDDQSGAIMSFWTNWLKNKLKVQNL